MTGPYETSLTVPAGRPEDNPAEVELEIEGEVVVKVDVDYPAGCHYLVGTAIFYGIKQLWPVEAGSWFRANKSVISFRPEWDMPERKVKLKFKGCSPTTAFDHKIVLRVETADMPAAKPWQMMYDFIKIIKRLTGIE